MRKGGGKQKGASFERKVCQQLSLWVSGGKKKDVFWRSAMSGGRATVALKHGDKLSRQAGDICAVAPEGHKLTDLYYFELKHCRNLRLDLFLFAQGPLWRIWQDTVIKARHHKRQPVLIVNTNRLPVIAIAVDLWPSASSARICKKVNSPSARCPCPAIYNLNDALAVAMASADNIKLFGGSK